MVVALSDPPVLSRGPLETPPSSLIAEQVRSLLVDGSLRNTRPEQRRHRRYPFPHLIRIVPVGPAGRPCGPAVVVCGKDLSSYGVGFYHLHPLPYQRVIVTFEGPSQQAVSILTVLRWCRFTRRGWYENGGRFVEIVETPEEVLSD